jgi:Domain of unknown function (DUF4062)
MNRKYQVFISSTYDDLKDQRDAVVKAVLELGHLPVGMEMFQAGDVTQWETIKSYIDSSDYYVVILAHRYGSKSSHGISYTEMEFDYAGQQKVPRLGFIIHGEASWPVKHIEVSAQSELDAFKKKLGSDRIVKFWSTTDQLAAAVFKSLSHEIAINPRVGWVRATEASSPQVAAELARLISENRALIEKLSTQPKDEITELLNRVTSSEYEVLFESQSTPIAVSMQQILLAVAASQKQTPYIHRVYNKLRAQITGIPDDDEFRANGIEQIEPALDEMELLGFLQPQRFKNGIASWYLTDKGKTLYARMGS